MSKIQKERDKASMELVAALKKVMKLNPIISQIGIISMVNANSRDKKKFKLKYRNFGFTLDRSILR